MSSAHCIRSTCYQQSLSSGEIQFDRLAKVVPGFSTAKLPFSSTLFSGIESLSTAHAQTPSHLFVIRFIWYKAYKHTHTHVWEIHRLTPRHPDLGIQIIQTDAPTSPYPQTEAHRDKYADTDKSIVLSSHFSDQQSDKSTRILMNTASEIPLPVYFVSVLESKNQECLQGVGIGGGGQKCRFWI